MTLLVAIGAAVLSQPPGHSVDELRAALNLPAGVHVQAVSYNNADTEPFDMFEADTTPDWGCLTQYISKPPAGFVADRYEYYSKDLVAAYSITVPKGTFERAPRHYRGGGAEMWLSPFSLLRCMDALAPGDIAWSGDDHRWVADFQTVTGELTPRAFNWTVTWDNLSQTLEIVQGMAKASSTKAVFSEWKALDGGGRWPMVCLVDFGQESGRHKRVNCASVAPLPASVKRPQPSFPKDVVLYEINTGRSLDHELKPVAAPPFTSSQHSATGHETAGPGVAVFGGASAAGATLLGIVLYRRVRAR